MSANDTQTETQAPESDAPRERWIEPVVEDYEAFYAAHPETKLSMDDIEGLRAEIHRRVRLLAPYADADQHTDLEAELTLRVLEAATGSRSNDPVTGKPIYDYMAQKQVYIVLHASGKVSSMLRRHWKEIEATVRLEDIAPHPEDGDPDENPLLILGPVDVLDRTPVRPTARLEHQELSDAIASRLSPAQTKIFRFLDAGYEPPEIAELLQLDRRTVHAHLEAIRKATEAVASLEADGIDLSVLRRRRARRATRATTSSAASTSEKPTSTVAG